MKNRNVCIPVNQFNKISWYCLGKANSWLAVVVICSTQATQVQHNKIQADCYKQNSFTDSTYTMGK